MSRSAASDYLPELIISIQNKTKLHLFEFFKKVKSIHFIIKLIFLKTFNVLNAYKALNIRESVIISRGELISRQIYFSAELPSLDTWVVAWNKHKHVLFWTPLLWFNHPMLMCQGCVLVSEFRSNYYWLQGQFRELNLLSKWAMKKENWTWKARLDYYIIFSSNLLLIMGTKCVDICNVLVTIVTACVFVLQNHLISKAERQAWTSRGLPVCLHLTTWPLNVYRFHVKSWLQAQIECYLLAFRFIFSSHKIYGHWTSIYFIIMIVTREVRGYTRLGASR